MKIVVLDGYCLNPGDLSWESLEKVGELTVYDRTVPEEAPARAFGAEILLTNKSPLDRGLIEGADSLRYIGLLATGYDVVDVEAARRRGIPVTNVPTYGTRSVAQMVMAHLLNLTQQVAHHAEAVRGGAWSRCPDWCFWERPLKELDGLMLGIVGFGKIGRTVARCGQALGMEVIVSDPRLPDELGEGIRAEELDELFRRCDVISLHCPLTPATRGLVNAERLSLMKPSALLINTSRGLLVEEEALARALNEGRIAGAGLDVLSKEPPGPDHPLIRARNCFITPHVAWATKAARERLLAEVVENLRAFLSGRPRNVVNP